MERRRNDGSQDVPEKLGRSRRYRWVIAADPLKLGAAAPIAAPARGTASPLTPRDPRALIMDAMGELRPIYEPPLVREMLASGIDSITVTLCDPKAVGAEALELAVDGLMEYDRYLTDHPELFVKATSAADVDEARRSGRMAVFYLYQNATQFDDDLDRVDMFRRLPVNTGRAGRHAVIQQSTSKCQSHSQTWDGTIVGMGSGPHALDRNSSTCKRESISALIFWQPGTCARRKFTFRWARKKKNRRTSDMM